MFARYTQRPCSVSSTVNGVCGASRGGNSASRSTWARRCPRGRSSPSLATSRSRLERMVAASRRSTRSPLSTSLSCTSDGISVSYISWSCTTASYVSPSHSSSRRLRSVRSPGVADVAAALRAARSTAEDCGAWIWGWEDPAGHFSMRTAPDLNVGCFEMGSHWPVLLEVSNIVLMARRPSAAVEGKHFTYCQLVRCPSPAVRGVPVAEVERYEGLAVPDPTHSQLH